jgi:hypothetical protein
MSVKFE